MTLVEVVKTSNAIKKFIEEDLLSHLAQINLSAAASAMAAVNHAEDKRSAIWSVINHLEATEAIYYAKLNTFHRFEAAQCLLYIKALKAVVYHSLGEGKLVKREFDSSLEVVAKQNRDAYLGGNQLKGIFSSWNPANWFALARHINSEPGKTARAFKPASFWEEFGYTGNTFYLDPGPSPDGN